MEICPKCGSKVPVIELITRRERHVVSLLVDEGLSNHEIGARLGIDENTVKHYLQRIFMLLGVNNRVQLATWWHTELFQLGLAA
jgi:DNA-binding NarL/FixJ family response regulator